MSLINNYVNTFRIYTNNLIGISSNEVLSYITIGGLTCLAVLLTILSILKQLLSYKKIDSLNDGNNNVASKEKEKNDKVVKQLPSNTQENSVNNHKGNKSINPDQKPESSNLEGSKYKTTKHDTKGHGNEHNTHFPKIDSALLSGNNEDTVKPQVNKGDCQKHNRKSDHDHVNNDHTNQAKVELRDIKTNQPIKGTKLDKLVDENSANSSTNSKGNILEELTDQKNTKPHINDEYDLDIHNNIQSLNNEIDADIPSNIDDSCEHPIKYHDYKIHQSEITDEQLNDLSFLFQLDSTISHILVAIRRDSNDNIASMCCMKLCRETISISYMREYIHKLPEGISKADFKYIDSKFMFCNTKDRVVYTRMLLKYIFAVSPDKTNVYLIVHDSAGIDKRIIYDLVVQYSNKATSSIVSNGVIVEVTLHVVDNKIYKIIRAVNLVFMLNGSVEEICTVHGIPDDILYFENNGEYSNNPITRAEFLTRYLFTIASAMVSEKINLSE